MQVKVIVFSLLLICFAHMGGANYCTSNAQCNGITPADLPLGSLHYDPEMRMDPCKMHTYYDVNYGDSSAAYGGDDITLNEVYNPAWQYYCTAGQCNQCDKCTSNFIPVQGFSCEEVCPCLLENVGTANACGGPTGYVWDEAACTAANTPTPANPAPAPANPAPAPANPAPAPANPAPAPANPAPAPANPAPAPANPEPAPAPTAPEQSSTPTAGGVQADPHVTSLGGGRWDFRGKDNTIFALWAAAQLHINGMTQDRMFMKKGGQIVDGSYFVRVAVTVEVSANMTLHAEILAEQPGSFRLFGSDDAEGLYVNRTSLKIPDLSLSITPKGEFVLISRGVKVLVQWAKLRTPLNAAGKPVAKDDTSHWYLDVSFVALDNTMPAVAPHGLIGQSFDGSKMTVHGKRDNYGRGRKYKTSAQGEGAIEGTYSDYIVAGPFATSFKFSRFGVHTPVAPRNVAALTGRKEPKVVGVNAGSVEDDTTE